MPQYDAILPAGGRISGELAARAGTEVKAMMRFGGGTILERTLAAIQPLVRTTAVIGGPEARDVAAAAGAVGVEEGDSGPENIFRGLEAVSLRDPHGKVLLVTTDLPFVCQSTFERLIALSPEDREIAVPLILRSEFERTYPGTSSTFVGLRGEEWTLGGAFIFEKSALRNARPHIEKVFAQRKSKLGMAKLLGPAFLAKFVTKRLTLEDVERKIQDMLGCSGAAVRNAPVELAYDIDDLEDFSYAVTYAEGRA